MASTTMKRIASELGVSITTVSKVLNNHDDISPATRARVMAKVEELGYRPNAVARSLTLRRTHTLGIVIPDLMHSFFVEIVAGIEPVASERGYGLLLCSSGESSAKERSELQLLHGRQVDGIILAPSQGIGNAEVLNDLHAHGTGLVMIDRDDYPERAMPSRADRRRARRHPRDRALAQRRASSDRPSHGTAAHARAAAREGLEGGAACCRDQPRPPTGWRRVASWRATATPR